MIVAQPQLCTLANLTTVHFQECMINKIAKPGCAWLMAASLWACAGNSQTTDCVPMPEAKPLTGETVKTEVDALLPRAMFVVDGKLGIYKEREEFMFDFYTLPDFKFLCSTAPRGQGPDDLIGLECRNIEVSDTTFSALEHMTWRLKTMKLAGDSAMQVVHTSKPLDANGAINMFHRLDSLHYLSLGSTSNQKEFCIYDISDGSAHETGEYPEWIDPATLATGMPLLIPYGKFLAVSPDGNRFAAFYWHFDRVRFFDRDCKMLMDITTSHDSNGKQEDDDENKLPSCYFGVKAAGDKIYALHADSDSTRLLEIWDWDGHPKSVFRLDRPVTIMTVDTKTRRVIAKDAEHSNEIYLYELPGDY